MSNERHAPDALIGNTGHGSCALSDLTSDPDSGDANWCVAADNKISTECHVAFATPSGDPAVGADLQEFRAEFRRTSGSGSGTPTARLELWENGALVRAGSEVDITSDTSQVVSFPWNANEISNADGSLVECKTVTTAIGGQPAQRSAIDTGGIEWNAEIPDQVAKFVTDAGTGADAVAGLGVTLSVSDAGAGADALVPAASLTLTESGAGADSVAGVNVTLGIADAGTGNDALAPAASLSLSESASGADVLSLAALLALADSANGADAIDVGAALTLLDTGAGADVLGGLSALVPVSDAGTGSDGIAGITVTLSVSDTGAGADDVDVTQLLFKAVSDLAAGDDAIGAVRVHVPVTDIGTGADSPGIAARVPASDSGSGADDVSIGAAVGIGDAGAGADSQSIQVQIGVGDSGTGSDAVLLRVLLQVADAMQGGDSVACAVSASVSDSASGADAVAGIAALLRVLDQVNASDVVTIFDPGKRIVTMTFTLANRSVVFAPLLARSIDFQFSARSMEFALN